MKDPREQGKPAPGYSQQIPVLPEVRLLQPGATLRLCNCGNPAHTPNCPADCPTPLIYTAKREQRLLLCRCGRSKNGPFCDGSHNPSAPSWQAKWRRFWRGL